MKFRSLTLTLFLLTVSNLTQPVLAQRPADEYTTSERIYIYASLTYYNLSSTGLVWKAAVKVRDTYTDPDCTSADDDECAKSHYMYIFPKTSTGQASFWNGDFTNFTMKEGSSSTHSYALEKNFPPDDSGFIDAFTTILSMSMTMARIVEEMGYSPTAIYIPKIKFVSNKGERLVPPAMDFTFQLLDPVILDTDAAQTAYIEELRKQIEAWKQKYADLQAMFDPGECPECNCSLETDPLEAQIKALEKQIADLIASIGNKLKTSSQKARDAGISFTEGSTSIGTAVNAVDALIAALTKAQNDAKIAQDTIIIRDNTIAGLNTQIGSLNSAIANLQAEIAKAGGDIDALIAERDGLIVSLTTRTSELTAMTADRDAKSAALTAMTAERDALTTTLATRTSERDKALSDLATRTSELNTANSTITSLNSQIATLNSTLATLTSERDAKIAELETANSTIATLNSTLATRTSERDTALTQLATANAQVSSLTSTLATRTAERDAALAEVTAFSEGPTLYCRSYEYNSGLYNVKSDWTINSKSYHAMNLGYLPCGSGNQVTDILIPLIWNKTSIAVKDQHGRFIGFIPGTITGDCCSLNGGGAPYSVTCQTTPFP